MVPKENVVSFFLACWRVDKFMRMSASVPDSFEVRKFLFQQGERLSLDVVIYQLVDSFACWNRFRIKIVHGFVRQIKHPCPISRSYK